MEIEEEDNKRNQEIPLNIRWEIVHLKRQGLTGSQVASRVSCSTTQCNAIFRKWKETGDVVDLPRSGRPLKATSKIQNMIIEEVQQDPSLNVDQIIEESKVEVSNTTARRVLKEHKFRYKTAPEKWALTDQHCKDRLNWAREFISKPAEFWNRIVFTDECKIQRNPNKQKVWVPEGANVPSTQSDRWQDSIMVWGAISFKGISILHVIDDDWKSGNYLKMLKRKLLRNIPNLHPKNSGGEEKNRLIFQQDGASIHRSSTINEYFEERGIELLSWPPKSPDLSLIESVWAYLKSKLKRSYDSREELEEDIIEQWHDIPVDFIQNLYNSMFHRIQAVIDMNGGPTDY